MAKSTIFLIGEFADFMSFSRISLSFIGSQSKFTPVRPQLLIASLEMRIGEAWFL